MSRTRVRFRRAVAASLLAAVAVAAAGRAAGSSDASSPSPGHDRGRAGRHVVQPWDTVWAIARARAGPEADPRPLVEAIREVNGLEGAAIRPGMALVIPSAP